MSPAGLPEAGFPPDVPPDVPSADSAAAAPPLPETDPTPQTEAVSEIAPGLVPEAETAASEAAGPHSDLLGEIHQTVRELAGQAERYHMRAEQREGVIDHLRSEVERLRRGERRGLLRPMLVEVCRLRNDLLRQAEDLPDDFDAERARLLLRSYAESAELVLEGGGIVTFSPQEGDPFEPRMHRRVGGLPASDPAAAGHIARVRRSGYLDVEAGTPIAPAEVVVFAQPVPADPADSDLAPARQERSTP